MEAGGPTPEAGARRPTSGVRPPVSGPRCPAPSRIPRIPPSVVLRYLSLLLLAPAAAGAQVPDTLPVDTARPPLTIDLDARLEAKGERTRNNRCAASATAALNPAAACRAPFVQTYDLQFALRSGGVLAERFHVDVDYDSRREFDASNTLGLRYEGVPGQGLERVELGNVTFAPPPSRFLTSGIPSGNYGIQAAVSRGRFRMHAIAAQQKGNVHRDVQFVVGERTLQGTEREIEDYQVETRRFFYTVDPRLLQGWPSLDILDPRALTRARAALPDTLRPERVVVYRVQFGAQPQNPSGPRFRLIGDPLGGAAGTQTYDVLREGADYVIDPSRLWIALVRPLNQANERLVVAYTVRIGGVETVHPSTGGTPDLQATGAPQFANLLWDPRIGPDHDAFHREIRSAYRIGGSDLLRESVRLRVVTGAGEQERPVAGRARTYLEMLGLAQGANAAELDFEGRLWPRASDPAFVTGANIASDGVPQRVIGEYFLVMPSARPFASARAGGLIEDGNQSNEAIYSAPGEFLTFASTEHPASVYRLRVSYQTSGTGDAGALFLGSVQVRRFSERLLVDGRPLVRDLDYTIDYELGRVEFTRPDTLFTRPRTVTVRYEENPLFASTPTMIVGMTSQYTLGPGGYLALTALSQQQRTPFTRPQLGFEAASSLVAGLTGSYTWGFGRGTDRASGVQPPASAVPSLTLHGELALSRPFSPNEQAYLESFEGEGGISVNLFDNLWYYASLPATGTALPARFGAGLLSPDRAATLVWQTGALDARGRELSRSLRQIDPRANVSGSFAFNETLLWLTLYPLEVLGRPARPLGDFAWTAGDAPPGRRFRSIRTPLSPSGVDLTRVEHLEFWALVDTTVTGRGANPTLVVDVGDISENSLVFAPETLTVRSPTDSVFTGRRIAGFDRLDSERDPFTRIFDATVNDRGLPGDRAEQLTVIEGGIARVETDVPLCRGRTRAVQPLGDPRANCTVANGRLDEEDLDLDFALNLTGAERERERILRWVIDLADSTSWSRIGSADTLVVRPRLGADTAVQVRRWVLVRVPFRAPTDSVGDVERRRMRALRLTMISGGIPDDAFSTVPLARMRFVGAPWVKRTGTTIAGIGGTRPGAGQVLASVIGTTDRDSLGGLDYQSPPGVVDERETVDPGVGGQAVQINERSLRLQATDLPLHHRAEAFFRFPTGQQNVMGYEELRVWARGRGNGWMEGTAQGELEFFIKLGRDENNFYLYRTPVRSGPTRDAWLPEVRVDFNRFFRLRQQLERLSLAGNAVYQGCTGADSVLVANSGRPASGGPVYAACDDGYIVYSADPIVTPPNLAALQEIAVGMIRMRADGASATSISPGDTLEVWVDDIRLSRVVNDVGVAGELGATFTAGRFGDVRVSYTRRDAHFRQLGERPSFVDDGRLDITASFRLDRFAPGLNLALPLTITHSGTAQRALFVSRTDLRGGGLPGGRDPGAGLTSYSLVARRAEPTGNLLLDHLSVTSTVTSGSASSEFTETSTRRTDVVVDYNVAAEARTLPLPGWLGAAAEVVSRWLGDDVEEARPQQRPTDTETPRPRTDTLAVDTLAGAPAQRRDALPRQFRWNPSVVRLTSAVVHGDDRRDAWLRPAESAGDFATRSDATNRLWRNGGTLELRPANAFSMRWDLSSIRDRRRYDRATLEGLAVAGEGAGELLGLRTGFERERTVQSFMALSPRLGAWLRPRADWGTTYTMLRDPNTRTLLVLDTLGATGADSAFASLDSLLLPPGLRPFAGRDGRLTLARRAFASRALNGGLTVDVPAAIAAYADTARAGGALRFLMRFLSPVELTASHSTLAAFDAAAGAPSLLWQLGFARGTGARAIGDELATQAGATRLLALATSFDLPLGATLVTRARRTDNRSWFLDADRTHAAADADQVVFPDVALRWRLPDGRFGPWVRAFTGNVGYTDSRSIITLLDETGFRTTSQRTVPVAVSVAWNTAGALSTTAGYTRTMRSDSLPGSDGRGTTDELRFDVGRSVRVPASWGLGLRSDVRLRAGYQGSHTATFVTDRASGLRRRLADLGRQAWSLDADTELSETLALTFQGSHVTTFDRNLDRRIRHLVLSTVLQLRLSSGG